MIDFGSIGSNIGGIIGDVLKKKGKGDSPFSGVAQLFGSENPVDGAGVSQSPIASASSEIQPQAPIVEVVAPGGSNDDPESISDYQRSYSQDQTPIAPSKIKVPERYKDVVTEEEYQRLIDDLGFTSESLEGRFNFLGGDGQNRQIFERNVTKPEFDQKKADMNRALANTGDSFRLLGDLFIASQGGYVYDRDPKDSALLKALDKEEKMKNLYMQQLERYDDGLYNAEAKDAELGRANWLRSRKELADALKDIEDRKRYKAEQEAKKEAQDKRDKAAAELADRKQKEVERANKARESQGWARINNSNTTSGKGSAGKSDNQIIIDANPNDPEAQEDRFGNRVRMFDLPKGDIVRYAEAAMADQGFMSRHKELILQTPDKFGEGQYKYAPIDVIARTYFKELYNNQWEESSEGKGPVLGGRWNAPDFLKKSDQIDGVKGFWEN